MTACSASPECAPDSGVPVWNISITSTVEVSKCHVISPLRIETVRTVSQLAKAQLERRRNIMSRWALYSTHLLSADPPTSGLDMSWSRIGSDVAIPTMRAIDRRSAQ